MMSDSLIDALLELYGIIRAGHATQITSSIEDITGRKPTYFHSLSKTMPKLFHKRMQTSSRF